MRDAGVPGLDVLGPDLLAVPAWRRGLSLATPFLLVALFFMFAGRGMWPGALADGITLQPRLWAFAFRRGRDRSWVVAEAASVLVLVALAGFAVPSSIAPAAYVGLMIGGSWIYPFMTSFVPHDPTGTTDLT